MTTSVKNILQTFEKLHEFEKRELATEIVRRTLDFDFSPPSDEDHILTLNRFF